MMKLKFNKTINTLITTVALLVPTFQIAQAQCEVGPILFRDTLFGAAVGAGVGALVLVANETSERIPAKLATATLIGAGAGVVIGVVELSFSDCGSNRQANNLERPGFHAQPMIAFLDNSINVPESSIKNSNSFDVSELKNMAMGLRLSYSFGD